MTCVCTSATFKEEFERLQKHQTIAQLEAYESSDLCNCFVLVSKPNEKLELCLDPARVNQVLNRPIHRGPTINDILPKLANVKYLTMIDVNSG